MPALSNIELPRPKDWNEFEDICLSVCKSRWENSNFTKFGRRGQKQDGVDIHGYNILGASIGVQCKNTLSSLTEKIIETEVNKAETFTPLISELYIATSASSDVNLQRYIMEMSKQRVASGKFGVGILFWSDIEQDLSKNINEVARFYPQFFNHNAPSKKNDSLRVKDIAQLQELLEYIDIESTLIYLEDAPKYIGMNFLEHEEPIRSVFFNSIFQLYDKNLEKNLHEWLQKRFDIANNIRFNCNCYNYDVYHDHLSFVMPGDQYRNLEEKLLYEELEDMVADFLSTQNNFCKFIHEKYPEINLRETGIKAREFFKNLSFF